LFEIKIKYEDSKIYFKRLLIIEVLAIEGVNFIQMAPNNACLILSIQQNLTEVKILVKGVKAIFLYSLTNPEMKKASKPIIANRMRPKFF
jgi:hypothetical protein